MRRTAALLLLWAPLACGAPEAPPREPFDLSTDPVERSIEDGETHVYQLPLEAGEAVRLRAEQQGADVVLRLRDPAGETRGETDSLTGSRGAERLGAVTERGGLHRVEVEAFPGAGGRYRVSLERRRPATPEDHLEARGFQALRAGETTADPERLARALEIFETTGDGWSAARVLEAWGGLELQAGRLQQGMERFTRAARGFEQAGDVAHEALARNQICRAAFALGDTDRALAACRRALELRRLDGDSVGAANVLYNLARLHQSRAESQQALDRFEQALEQFRTLGDSRSEAKVLHELGAMHLDLGRRDRALELLEAAEDVWGRVDDPAGLAPTLSQIGRAHREAGDPDAAEPFHLRALALQRASGDRLGEAISWVHLGLIDEARDRIGPALARFRRALEAARQLGRRQMEAEVQLHLGSLLAEAGHPDRAIEPLTEARRLFEELDLPTGRVWAEGDLARAERDRGRPEAALDAVERSLAVAETIRRGPDSLDLRASYFSTVQGRFDLWIGLLMDQGRIGRALEVRERARVRSLLDVLGTEPAVSEPTETISLVAMRREVLDPGTLLLEIHLGRERSFGWIVTDTDLEAVELPPREEVEAAAETVRKLLARSHRAEAKRALEQALRHLATLVVEPLAPHLDRPRIAFVPDGALEMVPLGALPDPRRPETVLLEGHEIVVLPSVSALALQRRQPRSPPEKEMLVFADPDFGGAHPPLPSSAREAEAILGHFGSAESLLLRGELATRQGLLEAEPRRFRRLHFATHALADLEEPTRSGLALAGGRLWRAREIRAARLSADLVVLSACRTGVGRELRGEGVLSLARDFLHAGARQVVTSHWAVDDEATARLMERFYARHLGDGLPGAAALRAAQLELRGDSPWSAPYHWAGFTMQGDWR